MTGRQKLAGNGHLQEVKFLFADDSRHGHYALSCRRVSGWLDRLDPGVQV
jgi:hypothetical protein